ncbi:MAG: M48 family metalloprotease [Sedimentisphaerales bacterium]|nr:M48 family metalloprotease [Sedimentisphaerales bacterium]
MKTLAIKAVSVVFIIVMIMIFSGCQVNPVTGRDQLVLISETKEIALGNQYAPEFEKDFGAKVDNPRLQSYVSEIGGQIAAVSDRPMPYEFALLASEVPNAFALPGGRIYVTAGLMKLMDNERQLAAVLSHEVVHVAAKHSVDSIQRQMGAEVVLEIAGYAYEGKYASQILAVSEVAAQLGQLRYSRDDEYEADSYGIKYMIKAGYNPWGMVELQQKLLEAQTSDPGSLEELFSSHPLSKKRIKNAREIISSNYSEYTAPAPPDPGATRFLSMKKLLK